MTKTIGSVLAVALLLSSPAGCSDPGDPAEPDAAALDAAALDAAVPDAAPIDTPIDVAVDAPIDAIEIDADPSQPQPVLRYAFEGNGANSGTLGPAYAGVASSVTFVPGKYGQAIRFDASSATIFAIAGTAGVFSARRQLTIGLWFRETPPPPAGPFTRYLLDNRQGERGLQTYHGVNVEPLTTCSDGGCASFDYPLGAWHHLLYRYDADAGARVEIFLDGAPVAALLNPSAIPLFGPGVGDLKIGVRTAFTVDQLVVYEQVMTDAQQCTLVVGGTWSGTACTPAP